jgi:kynureninase
MVEKFAKVLYVSPDDISFAASLTTGLHVLMSTFYKPTPKKNKIVMLSSEFNSDIMASESWIENYGFNVKDTLILVDVSDSDP